MDTMRTTLIPLKSARGRLIPELPYTSDLLGSPARPDWNVVVRRQCGVLPRDLAEFLDDSKSPITDFPKRLAREQTSLTEFFAGLRGWSATVKARPPPWRLSRGHDYVFS